MSEPTMSQLLPLELMKAARREELRKQAMERDEAFLAGVRKAIGNDDVWNLVAFKFVDDVFYEGYISAPRHRRIYVSRASSGEPLFWPARKWLFFDTCPTCVWKFPDALIAAEAS